MISFKGGLEHKHLQLPVKRFVEGFGHRATIVKPLGDGYGYSIDVALEKEGMRIASEITVPPAPVHELGKIRKGLEARYDHVVVLSTDPKKLASVRMLVHDELSKADQDMVRFFAPDEFFQFVESLETRVASRERTVRGYKVKVRYGTLKEREKAGRQRAMAQVFSVNLLELRSRWTLLAAQAGLPQASTYRYRLPLLSIAA